MALPTSYVDNNKLEIIGQFPLYPTVLGITDGTHFPQKRKTAKLRSQTVLAVNVVKRHNH